MSKNLEIFKRNTASAVNNTSVKGQSVANASEHVVALEMTVRA